MLASRETLALLLHAVGKLRRVFFNPKNVINEITAL